MTAATTNSRGSSIAKLGESARAIQQIASECNLSGAGNLESELQIAMAVGDIRDLMTPEVMKPIMSLMNTDIGFNTDRDPRKPGKDGPKDPYTIDVVRECCIEAMLRGFHVVGNEFNIIAGRFYGAKNGFQRKVLGNPDVQNFQDTYEVPRLNNDRTGAVVKCKATFTLNGQPMTIDREYAIRVNAMMGADAILGKATRKLYKDIHDKIFKTATPSGDVDDEPIAKIGTTTQDSSPEIKRGSVTATAPVTEIKPEVSIPDSFKKAPKAKAEKPVIEVVKTPQTQLAEMVIGWGHTFDTFAVWAREGGFFTDDECNRLTCFDDVLTERATKLLEAFKGLQIGLDLTKKIIDGGAQ